MTSVGFYYDTECVLTYMFKWSFKYLVCKIITRATSLGRMVSHVLQDRCSVVKEHTYFTIFMFIPLITYLSKNLQYRSIVVLNTIHSVFYTVACIVVRISRKQVQASCAISSLPCSFLSSGCLIGSLVYLHKSSCLRRRAEDRDRVLDRVRLGGALQWGQ